MRVGLAFDQGIAADEVVLFGLDWHGEADARLEGVGLVGELGAGEDEAGLDPEQVECLEPHRDHAPGAARLEDGVPDCRGVVGVAEHLEAQFARVAGARHHQGNALVVADASHGEAEPAQLLDGRLVGAGPDDLAEDLAAERALYLDVVELVGGVPDEGVEAAFLGLPA